MSASGAGRLRGRRAVASRPPSGAWPRRARRRGSASPRRTFRMAWFAGSHAACIAGRRRHRARRSPPRRGRRAGSRAPQRPGRPRSPAAARPAARPARARAPPRRPRATARARARSRRAAPAGVTKTASTVSSGPHRLRPSPRAWERLDAVVRWRGPRREPWPVDDRGRAPAREELLHERRARLLGDGAARDQRAEQPERPRRAPRRRTRTVPVVIDEPAAEAVQERRVVVRVARAVGERVDTGRERRLERDEPSSVPGVFGTRSLLT